MSKVKSKKQASLFGAIISGVLKQKGLSKKKVKEMMKGTKLKGLPTYKKK